MDTNKHELKKFFIRENSCSFVVKNPAKQARIVAMLDKFDTLTQSISEGLPREIELRQKQYEHYRNLLLSFPKPEKIGTTNGHQ